MDKKWMLADRLSIEYKQGVQKFLEFCLENAKDPNAIMCPCVKCGNLEKLSVSEITEHLYFNGIDKSYDRWIWHGKNVQSTELAPKKNCRGLWIRI